MSTADNYSFKRSLCTLMYRFCFFLTTTTGFQGSFFGTGSYFLNHIIHSWPMVAINLFSAYTPSQRWTDYVETSILYFICFVGMDFVRRTQSAEFVKVTPCSGVAIIKDGWTSTNSYRADNDLTVSKTTTGNQAIQRLAHLLASGQNCKQAGSWRT